MEEMDALQLYETDLEIADMTLRRIKNRLFTERDPQVLRQAMENFRKKNGKYPDMKSYWDVLITGVQHNVNKKRNPPGEIMT